jgi:GT2 family glycosyltransferase
MLSIVMNARNVPDRVKNCLISLQESVARLRMETSVEYVFADDASDPGKDIISLCLEMRQKTKAPVKILRFKKRQHYTAGLAYTFSAAAGDSILFVSHDMVVTPDYIRTLLAVAALDPSIGLVRGTSPYVDCFPEHQIPIVPPPRKMEDIFNFGAFVAKQNGLNYVEVRHLTGDSMLINANALQKVGIFDNRYFGYFGDADFGLRIQRAGLKMVCAKGAWLLHEGAAYYIQEAAGKEMAPIHQARMVVVGDAYKVFRQKWDPTLPPEYPGTDAIDFPRLLTVPPPQGGEFQPRLAMNPDIVEQL